MFDRTGMFMLIRTLMKGRKRNSSPEILDKFMDTIIYREWFRVVKNAWLSMDLGLQEPITYSILNFTQVGVSTYLMNIYVHYLNLL